MAQPAEGADQGVDAGLPETVAGSQRGGLGGFDRRYAAAPGRLLAAEFKPGEEGIPLGVDAGGVALPLDVKGIELGAVLCGGGVGTGNAVIVRVRETPFGMTVIE